MSESQVLALALEVSCPQQYGWISSLPPIFHDLQSCLGCLAATPIRIIVVRSNLPRIKVADMVSL